MNLPTAWSHVPEMPTTWPRSLMAVAAPEVSPRAEKWRPWRAYAALHLWLLHDER